MWLKVDESGISMVTFSLRWMLWETEIVSHLNTAIPLKQEESDYQEWPLKFSHHYLNLFQTTEEQRTALENTVQQGGGQVSEHTAPRETTEAQRLSRKQGPGPAWSLSGVEHDGVWQTDTSRMPTLLKDASIYSLSIYIPASVSLLLPWIVLSALLLLFYFNSELLNIIYLFGSTGSYSQHADTSLVAREILIAARGI